MTEVRTKAHQKNIADAAEERAEYNSLLGLGIKFQLLNFENNAVAEMNQDYFAFKEIIFAIKN